jgi:hypothetical protein
MTDTTMIAIFEWILKFSVAVIVPVALGRLTVFILNCFKFAYRTLLRISRPAGNGRRRIARPQHRHYHARRCFS